MPSADAIGLWLRRPPVRAGIRVVNRDFARRVITSSPENDLTLDVDATYMATEKECAEYNYNGVKSFSVLTGFISDLDLRIGSVGSHQRCRRHTTSWSRSRAEARSHRRRQEKHLLAAIKLTQAAGKRLACLRSDSAGHTAEVINCCQEHGITFTITADQDAAVKQIIKDQQRQGTWKRLYLQDETRQAFTLIYSRRNRGAIMLLRPMTISARLRRSLYFTINGQMLRTTTKS